MNVDTLEEKPAENTVVNMIKTKRSIRREEPNCSVETEAEKFAVAQKGKIVYNTSQKG